MDKASLHRDICGAVHGQSRAVVDSQKPRFQVVINEDVKPEKLEAVVGNGDRGSHSQDRENHHVVDLPPQPQVIHIPVPKVREEPAEGPVAALTHQLLDLLIRGSGLADAAVGQMGVSVLQIPEVKLFSGEPHQPLAVCIDGQRPEAGDADVDAEVTLVPAHKQRVADVFLYHVRVVEDEISNVAENDDPPPPRQLCRLTDPVSRLGIQHLLLLEVLGHKLDVVTVHDERQGRELIEGLTVEPSHVCRALGQAVLPSEGGRARVVVQPLPGFDIDMLCHPEGGRPPVEIPVLHVLMLLVKPVPPAL